MVGVRRGHATPQAEKSKVLLLAHIPSPLESAPSLPITSSWDFLVSSPSLTM